MFPNISDVNRYDRDVEHKIIFMDNLFAEQKTNFANYVILFNISLLHYSWKMIRDK